MIGTIVGGKYMIDSVVGEGGMARVYKAHNVESNEIVAIKVVREEYRTNTQFLRRFEREARSGMTLSHENIVKYIDVGKEEDFDYIVMEYISGYTLKEYIERFCPISSVGAINLVTQILDALDHAHKKGIIHRDVKPQNVMINSQGVVKLADFGIARIVNSKSTSTFQGSRILGSAHYIAPEQAKGNDVSEQSDLYAVGVILYELLTGTVPFDGESDIEVIMKHIDSDILPPSDKNPDVSPALNYIVKRAMAKDKRMRFANAADMKRALLLSRTDTEGIEIMREFPELPVENGKINRGVSFVAWILLGCLLLTIGLFVIVTAKYNAENIIVPDLIGKDVAEMQEKYSDKFTIVVTGSEVSSEHDPNVILNQLPISGTRVDYGGIISVTINIDANSSLVPSLSGLTLLEANNAIIKAGLTAEKVIYDETSTEPAGTVCKQTPNAGDIVKRNSSITLYISGTPIETAYMPNVVSENIEDAASKLIDVFGFSRIIVTYHESDTETPGKVFEQNVKAGLETDKSTMIKLEVYGSFGGAYTSDRAYNITVENNDTPVFATVVTESGYEVVVFNVLMPSGAQVASYTAHVPSEGVYECVLYIGEVEYKREKATFTYND